MRRAEQIGCVFFFLLGAHIVQQATLLAYQEKYGPGPGFMPLWLGLAMMLLGSLHFVNILMQSSLYPGAQPFPKGRGALRLLSVYGILLVSVFLLGTLGLLIAIVAMVGTILYFVEKMRWRSSLIAAVAIACGYYLLFSVALGVPFPSGPFGI